MKKTTIAIAFFLLMGILAAMPGDLRAQGKFEQVSGKDFEKAVPKDFYLEGNAIPTEKRNATLVKTPSGARVIFALIDTTGYSSQIQAKYIGMLIAEGEVSLGDVKVGVGSYGFGFERPAASSNADGKFHVYNQAGAKVGDCAAKKDAQIKTPRPLQVILTGERPRLYLGRYWLELSQ